MKMYSLSFGSSFTAPCIIFPAPGKSVRLAICHGIQLFYDTEFD
jgi:hypothetical protein